MSSTAAATPSAAALTSPTSLMPICPRLYRASWELLPGPSFPEWATSERAQPPRDNPGWFQALCISYVHGPEGVARWRLSRVMMVRVHEQGRHWDDAYRSHGAEGVSWFQPEPAMSLELIRLLGVEPCRVATSDNYDGAAGTKARFDIGSGVVDAPAFEVAQALHRKASIARTAGSDHSSSRHGRAIGQVDDQVAGFFAQSDSRAGSAQLGTELFGLYQAPPDEVATRDTRWETEVVLDPRARARLTTGGDHVHAQGPQALRSTVDRGCQASWASADDD